MDQNPVKSMLYGILFYMPHASLPEKHSLRVAYPVTTATLANGVPIETGLAFIRYSATKQLAVEKIGADILSYFLPYFNSGFTFFGLPGDEPFLQICSGNGCF